MLFAVLEGMNPGKVFVDNAENPLRALALLPHDNAVCIGGKFDQKPSMKASLFLESTRTLNYTGHPRVLRN